MLKRPSSRACALETAASFLALPVPCVPGTGENARGREALGTRMILAGYFYSGSLELLCFGPKLFMYFLHHILKFYDLTQIRLSVWVVESVGLPKFEFNPATEKVPRTIHKRCDVVSLEFDMSGSRRNAH